MIPSFNNDNHLATRRQDLKSHKAVFHYLNGHQKCTRHQKETKHLHRIIGLLWSRDISYQTELIRKHVLLVNETNIKLQSPDDRN